MTDEFPEPMSRDYPTTIEEMGWKEYLIALSERLESHLPDTIGARAKRDIGNAAKVLRAFSDMEGLTAYLDTLSSD